MLECVYEIRRDRFARIVRTTIRVAPRDGVVELVFFAFPRCEIHAGQELWFGFGGDSGQCYRKERRPGWVTLGQGGPHLVFHCANPSALASALRMMQDPPLPLGVHVPLASKSRR